MYETTKRPDEGPHSGRIESGSRIMLDGGLEEGTNQDGEVVLQMVRSPAGTGEVVRAPCGFPSKIFLGGLPQDGLHHGDVDTRAYSRLFRKGPAVDVLFMNPNPVTLGLGFTARMADGMPCDGTAYVRAVCDTGMPLALLSLLNTDYVHGSVRRSCSSSYTVTSLCLARNLNNELSSNLYPVIRGTATPEDSARDLNARMLEICRDDGAVAMRGLRVVDVRLRFAESPENELLRFKGLVDRDIRRRRIEGEAEFEKFAIGVDIARREHALVTGGGSA